MQLHQQTSTDLAADLPSLAHQVRTLADKAALVSLSAMYSLAVDDHDLVTTVDCFAEDGQFTRAGVTVTGHDALRDFYRGMMDRYVTTLHIPQVHLSEVDTVAGTAVGLVTGQAELAIDGRLLMAAYRYDDTYLRLTTTRWVFQSRVLKFMYNVPFEQMPTSFADRRRIRLPGTPYADGDFPETVPTWDNYGL